MRPRVLYFATFVFYSLSGGRFTATFLEHELHFSENWMISAAVASQLLASSLCKPWLGGMADSWEATSGGENSGRLRIISLGLMTSTVATLLHCLGIYYMHWRTSDDNDNQFDIVEMTMYDSQSLIPLPLLAYHLILRIVFALGTAACSPALDGLTLAQLERDGMDKQNYGKERMYGALSWGISHIMLGKVIDLFGYSAIYGTTLLAFVGCIIVFHVYARSNAELRYVGVDKEGDTTNEDDQSDNGANESPDGEVPIISNENNDDDINANANTTQTNNTDGRLSSLDLIRILFQKASIGDVSFMISLFALFIGMSVVESMIFLYFEFLGGSTIMCGLTVCVTVLFELLLFHYAPDVLKLLGSTSMMQLACLAYVVRVIGYSFIPLSHPYLVLFFEPLHGVTIAFAMTSSVAFADEWVPKGYDSSGQGFMSMISGLGQFTGLCIGGVLGSRALYRALAVVVTLGSVPLGILKCWISLQSKRRGRIRGEEGDAQRNESIELYNYQL
ncbi:hypothetical protein ACHAXH_008662 [Discostella pseudostelligera]